MVWLTSPSQGSASFPLTVSTIGPRTLTVIPLRRQEVEGVVVPPGQAPHLGLLPAGGAQGEQRCLPLPEGVVQLAVGDVPDVVVQLGEVGPPIDLLRRAQGARALGDA